MTSKIANLWKRVEDSQAKAKAEESSKKYKPKDKRIWLGGGKKAAAPEPAVPAPGKLIRSGTYEKLAQAGDENMAEDTTDTTAKPPRSRSRLSMKLSKFSLKRRPSTGPTSPTMEDQVNGNTRAAAGTPEHRPPSSADSMSTGPDDPRPPLLALSNRSPASAIVAPFNYKPVPSSAVKRNTSYVSSIGRKREEEPSSSDEEKKTVLQNQQTSSAMVTLV